MNNPLPGSVEFWAQNKPDAIAIIEGERSLTWKQWNDRANCLAHAMHQRGIEAEDIVVVRTQIRLEWAIIRSALGKLGCRLLALNWRLTPSETRYILSNSNAKAIFCDDPDPDSLKPSWQHLHLKFAVSLDSEAAGFVSYQTMLEEESKQALFAAGDPPLIIFTSGTTGLPKGVVMNQPRPGSQTQMREYFISMAKSRPQVSGDIVLVTMPMHHGAGPALVSSGVRQGNTLIMMRRFDAEGALALIEKYRITFWNGVPTMFKRMACLPQVTLERFDVSSIRSLNVGAAPVTDDLKEWIINYFGNCLHEGYGTTETGMITALTPEMMLKKPGSSGLPYAHVKFSIRDDQQQQLPDGELGEIWVYTPMGISQYLTEALDHDTLDKDGFFRTGDIGHVDDEGYLYITDRSKDLIISGGVNIYPAEIENAILKHPSIQDCAVIGIPDKEFGEQVKAFYEIKPETDVNENELLAFCKNSLASYKRPKSFAVVDELPRNTMGKVLKRVLREPYWTQQERKV